MLRREIKISHFLYETEESQYEFVRNTRCESKDFPKKLRDI